MKLPIVVLIVGLAARCVAGGWGGAYIGGETAEGKCFYEAGETMTFRLNVGGLAALPEGTWTLRWTRTGDDGVTQTGSAPVSLSEPCVVTTSLDRPGFVRIQASIDGVSSRGKESQPTSTTSGGASSPSSTTSRSPRS